MNTATKTTKATMENTFISLIDLKAFCASICKELDLPDSLELRHYDGLIQRPKVLVMDREMVGYYQDEENGRLPFYLYEQNKPNPSGKGKIISMSPTHKITVTVDEITPFLLPNPITLAVYCEEWRNYNDRLGRNESNLIKFLNK